MSSVIGSYTPPPVPPPTYPVDMCGPCDGGGGGEVPVGGATEAKQDTIITKIDATNLALVTTNTELGTVNAKLVEIADDVDNISTGIGDINATLSNTYTETQNIALGVVDVLTAIGTTNTNLTNIEGVMTSVDDRLLTINDSIDATKVVIDAITLQLADVVTNTGATTTAIGTLETNVTTAIADAVVGLATDAKLDDVITAIGGISGGGGGDASEATLSAINSTVSDILGAINPTLAYNAILPADLNWVNTAQVDVLGHGSFSILAKITNATGATITNYGINYKVQFTLDNTNWYDYYLPGEVATGTEAGYIDNLFLNTNLVDGASRTTSNVRHTSNGASVRLVIRRDASESPTFPLYNLRIEILPYKVDTKDEVKLGPTNTEQLSDLVQNTSFLTTTYKLLGNVVTPTSTPDEYAATRFTVTQTPFRGVVIKALSGNGDPVYVGNSSVSADDVSLFADDKVAFTPGSLGFADDLSNWYVYAKDGDGVRVTYY